jgi:hypothetical protein
MAPGLLPVLPLYLGEESGELAVAGVSIDEGEWPTVTVLCDRLETARTKVLGLGGAVEVVAPEPLRLSVVDYARQIAGLYEGTG